MADAFMREHSSDKGPRSGESILPAARKIIPHPRMKTLAPCSCSFRLASLRHPSEEDKTVYAHDAVENEVPWNLVEPIKGSTRPQLAVV